MTKIISISKPILTRANMGFDFVSCQYGCLFSRCRKYVINNLIHGHFHIGLVIIPWPPYWPETESRANMGRGMISRPIWKCSCINLYLFYLRKLYCTRNLLSLHHQQMDMQSYFTIRSDSTFNMADIKLQLTGRCI
jgi:hypothetical protein